MAKTKAVSTNYIIKERKRWLFFGLPFTFETYTLTDKKILIKKGFVNTDEDEILLFRVKDLNLKRSLAQRIFGLGTLLVLSSDKSCPKLEMKNIKNVAVFREALSNQVESERIRLRYRPGEMDMHDTDFDADSEFDAGDFDALEQ